MAVTRNPYGMKRIGFTLLSCCAKHSFSLSTRKHTAHGRDLYEQFEFYPDLADSHDPTRASAPGTGMQEVGDTASFGSVNSQNGLCLTRACSTTMFAIAAAKYRLNTRQRRVRAV